jgi:hypothetical protein
MSYLDSPRFHFRGWFQADVSTINNDVTAFDVSSSAEPDPGWNPEGTGIFRFVDCTVTGAFLDGKQISDPTIDPVIGMTIQNADQHAPGKLVDLDPQQQMVSMIFGMQIRLVSASSKTLMRGEYKPTAFANLWARQVEGPRTDQKLGAMYQSVLEEVVWGEDGHSPLLLALREAARERKLSIEFNVFGYGRDPKIPRYTMGHVVGTIGPHLAGEPDHFVLGRHMIAQGPLFGTPAGRIGTLQAKIGADGLSLTVDFGNSFQIQTADSGLVDIGPVLLGVLNTNPDNVLKTVDESGVTVIGEVPYLTANWFSQTAGVQTFDLNRNPAAAQRLGRFPLVLLSPAQSHGAYDVKLQETINGVYVRADSFVFRINPGETQTIEFCATQFGAPLSAALALTNAGPFLAQLGGTPPNISVPPDGVNVPTAAGEPVIVSSGADGYASFALRANPNGPTVNGVVWPRGYIAGQLYALGYQLADQPPNYVSNPGNFVSILAYSHHYNTNNASPTWFGDIRPLFAQYGKLYPIMSKYVVDLSDYSSVVSRIEVLKLAFSLPEADPNHMPVTRDLGKADRAVILRWLGTKGADGLPPLGTEPVEMPPAAPVADAEVKDDGLLPLQKAGKTAVIMKFERAGGNAAKDNDE